MLDSTSIGVVTAFVKELGVERVDSAQEATTPRGHFPRRSGTRVVEATEAPAITGDVDDTIGCVREQLPEGRRAGPTAGEAVA